MSDQTTDGLPRKKERDLFAVKEWGVFDSVKGLGNGVGGLKLKVREVVNWCNRSNPWVKEKWENVFEMDVKETSIWKHGGMFFQHKHVLAFEKALNDDFRRPMDVSDEDFIGDGFDGGVKDSDQGK